VRLRTDAFKACAAGDYFTCGYFLDKAKGLDQKGESDPRVQEARKAIQKSVDELEKLPPEAPEDPTPPVAPYRGDKAPPR
jgi:hypothetical protein